MKPCHSLHYHQGAPPVAPFHDYHPAMSFDELILSTSSLALLSFLVAVITCTILCGILTFYCSVAQQSPPTDQAAAKTAIERLLWLS